ncbi:MAG: DNA polymerase I [Candidatus Latescibacteria bacterium]|nr:DNA polymerase I [Candidatus Latescibacterota bacterium]
MPETKKTLYLIDGSALMYRAYFAFIRNPLINSRGEDTSTTFGFANTLLSLLREHNPDYIAVVFDTGKPTFRHKMYDQYKATRQKMPDELIQQVDRVRESADALGITRIELEGYEADDIIGTLALQGAKVGLDVYMVTGDKDFMQLVQPGISMYVPMKNEIIGPENVRERYGVTPDQIIELFGLMGDSSDNVPGIPKVGEKTAIELLKQFGSLDEILNRWEEISKPSIRNSVGENKELAILSRKLVTIKTDVPIDTSINSLKFTGITFDSAIQFFREMEFTSLIDQISKKKAEPKKDVIIVYKDEIEPFFKELEKHKEFSIDLETTSVDPMRADIVGISIAAGDFAWYLPIGHNEGGNLDHEKVYPRLKSILSDKFRAKIGHNAKYDAIILRRNGFKLSPFTFDTMLAAYVIDPGSRSYSLKILSEQHLNHVMQPITELIGKGKNQVSFAEVDIKSAAHYSGDDADVTLKLKKLFSPRLEKERLDKLFREVEMPLMDVLMDMEMRGVCLDIPFLEDMSDDLLRNMEIVEKEIYEIAGEEFNINSPKQLGTILFDKIGLKPVRKSKTGPSTDVDVLTKLAHIHELPNKILDYRQLMKLKSTYVDALPTMVNPETGRVHTSYNQAVAATGRLSSSDPNLQNIPIRTELGRNIRKAFIAPPGYLILSADYSQIELRIMAHMSGDPVLTEAFKNGEDVHRKTASILFGMFPEMVSDDQRRQAKTINFGVMYGMGAYALSEQLGISRNEAKAFIDNYFRIHTGVKAFIEQTVAEAEKNDYVTTLLNRKRYVPDIHSSNHNVAEFAKRTAINTPIQGSAADLIKVSMINLSNRLRKEHPDTYMILQVHDELVFEVPEAKLAKVTAIVKETMEGAMKLSVPLVADTGSGTNWLEAH